MGSINLGNLLMNMHTSAVTNKTTTGQTNDTSNVGGFNKALDNAKQTNIAKNLDKKPSTINEVKVTPKKVTKSNPLQSVELEEEEVIKKEVTDAILSLISTQLQVPVEELTATLEEVGLSPIDLLEEDNFSQFITAFYGESATEDLLMENSEIKDISKLFTKIQEVSNQIVGDEVHKVIEQTTVDDELLNVQTVVAEKIPTTQQVEVSSLEEVVSSTVMPKEEKTVQTKELTSTQPQVVQTFPIEHLGLTVPVEAFETTISLTNDQVSQNMGGVHVNPDLNIASQIVDHIEVTKLEQMQEIKMQLSPKELGQLTIKLVEKNGVFVAEIKVESEKTKDFILNEIETLKDSLNEQGINISNVQVDVKQNDGSMQMQQQKQKSSKRIQEIIAKHLQELEEGEAQMQEVSPLDIGESEVDYMI